MMRKIIIKTLIVFFIIFALLALLSIRKIPETVNYGASYSVYHSHELGLDWKKTFDAIIHELGVRKFRFSAHWPLTEPADGVFNWTELDYQISEAEKTGSKVTLAVGRRLPGWPECHEPEWVKELDDETKRGRVLRYVEAVVTRYKDSSAIERWQVENEPFLTLFARHHCQDFLDKEFLQKEIDLVRSIDPNREILVTDSGELSLWHQAYNMGDVFGTSLYVYVWNHTLGPIRYPITPAFFRIKRNIIELINPNKETLLIELSLEPWLLQPIIDTPIETSLSRMDINKFNEILIFAKKAGFDEQYLWGAEWWYFMKEKNHPEFWEKAKEVF